MKKMQKNIGNTSLQSNHEQINLREFSHSNINGQNSFNSANNVWLNDHNQTKKNKIPNKSK